MFPSKTIDKNKKQCVIFGSLYLLLVCGIIFSTIFLVYLGNMRGEFRQRYETTFIANRFTVFGFAVTAADLDAPYSKDEWLDILYNEFVYDVSFFAYNQYFPVGRWGGEDTRFYLVKSGKFYAYFSGSNSVRIAGLDLSALEHDVLHSHIIEGRLFENDGEVVIGRNAHHFWDAYANRGFYLRAVYPEIGDMFVVKADGFYKELTIVGILAPYIFDRTLITTFDTARLFVDFPNIPVSSYYANVFLLDPGYTPLVRFRHYNDARYFTYAMLRESVTLSPIYQSVVNSFNTFTQTYFAWLWSLTYLLFFLLIIVSAIFTVIHVKTQYISDWQSSGTSKSRLIAIFMGKSLAFVWSITAIALAMGHFVFAIFVMPRIIAGVGVELHVSYAKVFLESLPISFGITTAVFGLTTMISVVYILCFKLKGG